MKVKPPRPASLIVTLIAFVLATRLSFVHAGIEPGAIKQIVNEGRNHSELMKNFEYLTDMIGPRLTGSKKFKRAAEWTAQRMHDYGLENVHLEGFDFGRGWQRGIAYGRMIAPYEMQLDFRALAWTPGTDGKVTGPLIAIAASNTSDLEKYKGKLGGMFILASSLAEVEPDLNPRPRRMSDREFREEETSWPGQPDAIQQMKRRMQGYQFRIDLAKFAKQEGAAAIITDAAREHGLLDAGSYPPGRDPKQPEVLPMVTMAHEHYGTLHRLVKRGLDVQVEMEIKSYFEDGDTNAYDVVGEIRGTEKPDELVILGAHLDSWDLGTGATDNGAGSMAVLEAARILKALGLKPRRTVRFILFGGEEQGLLGSRAYVAAHKDEMAKVSGVFVLDTGTGRVRGIGTQGNKGVIGIFEEILAPLREMGVQYVNERVQIGTDHLSFESAGVPGFAFFQDAIEYKEKTHHTQTDTLDKILPEDLEQGAIVMAVMAYSVAELPQLLRRKRDKAPAGN